MPRSCDACRTSAALVFCRADAAYLCMACDVKVHGANKLASRHERVWMCEVCEQAQAVVTCKADAASLCFSCDADIHSANPLASRHERVPLLPFYEAPGIAHVKVADAHPADWGGRVSVSIDGDEDEVEDERSAEEADSWLFASDGSSKTGLMGETFDRMVTLPSPLHDGSGIHAFSSMTSLKIFSDVDPFLDVQFAQAMVGAQQVSTDSIVPVHYPIIPTSVAPASGSHASEGEMASRKGFGFGSASISHSISSSSMEFAVVPDSILRDVSTPTGSGTLPRVQSVSQLEPKAREARVLRYKEKKRNRKFEKTIRYASRKVYAETRPRVKGRFAKRTEVVEPLCSVVPDYGFGIVPSF